ncbi:MAG TPA: ORF6N domain-containing protein [Candidatus Rifleibacterium sp.]|nr:ORF6N domain-containing protein [Candidatus Rifleibacterium sp.]HPW57256.1 ORF6N domain-containing protein [Candidatus Rifleibacterium sp.]HQB83570.1 ORF6N domain-containing protein [Candidatus Rifleibacterium sp.]
MLDSDLAELYDVETKRLNEQVKRNIERFPASFMFQLTYTEEENFEVAICDLKNRGCCPERNICEFNFWPARIPISASFQGLLPGGAMFSGKDWHCRFRAC